MPLPQRSKSTTTGSLSRAKGLQRVNPSSGRVGRVDSNGNKLKIKRTMSEGSNPRQRSQYKPEEFANRELPLIYKPKKIQKMGHNAYVFHCTIMGNSGTKFNKNMVVLVHGESNIMDSSLNNGKTRAGFVPVEEETKDQPSTAYLTVVNPLRLTEEGETHLKNLGGEIRNLIRLGPSEHAAFEDEFYLNKYPQVQRWAPGKFSSCPHLPLHHILYDTTGTKQFSVDDPISPANPHPDVEVFLFEQTVQPEALLYWPKKKTLLAGDCLQAQRDNPFINEEGMKHLQDIGVLVDEEANGNEGGDAGEANPTCDIVVISPLWLKSQCVVSNHSRTIKNSFRSNQAQRNKAFFTSSGKFKLRNDFQRLLQLSIKRFVSSSGNHVQSDDNGDIKASILAAAEEACQLV